MWIRVSSMFDLTHHVVAQMGNPVLLPFDMRWQLAARLGELHVDNYKGSYIIS